MSPTKNLKGVLLKARSLVRLLCIFQCQILLIPLRKNPLYGLPQTANYHHALPFHQGAMVKYVFAVCCATSKIVRVMPTQFAQAARAIRDADALLITAGAGMGVDSGLPDFRGREGFWKAYPAIAGLGLSFAEMANPAWFENDPGLAWAFYGHRLNLYRTTAPHAGFATLLAWATVKPAGYFVFTSNVDGHFQKAGFDPERVVECHGSIHHLQCVSGCRNSIWVAGDQKVEVDEVLFRAKDPLPACAHCGKLARPNILMFHDLEWNDERSHAQQLRLEQWIRRLASEGARLVVLELGAGTTIPTVRRMSENLARRLQGMLVRINPREPEVPANQIGLPLGALAGIQQLAAVPHADA